MNNQFSSSAVLCICMSNFLIYPVRFRVSHAGDSHHLISHTSHINTSCEQKPS